MSPTTHAFTLPAAGTEGPRIAVQHRAVEGGAPGVLFCGGFHSSMEGDKARFVAARCAEAGVACTRFDYRGHGASGGDARHLTLRDWLDDTLRVIDHLAEATGNDAESSDRDDARSPRPQVPGKAGTEGAAAPLVIVGSSMGAWLALRAALERPGRVRALLLIAAAPDFLQGTLLERLEPAVRERLDAGLEVTLPSPYDAAGWPITPALIDSGRALSVLRADVAGRVRCPVRMLHGDRDDTAPLERARTLCSLLGEGATLTVVEGGDHRLSDPASLALIERALARLHPRLDRERSDPAPSGASGRGGIG